jgi:GLPGLI family protein
MYMRYTIILALVAFAHTLIAQNTSGQINYTETIKLQIELPEGDEKMKAMLPPDQKSEKVLVFNEKASIYQKKLAKQNDDLHLKHEEDGGEFNIMIKVPEVSHYAEITTGQWTRAEEFFGKDFLIEGSYKDLKWKLTGEQKKIGDYICQKAQLIDSVENVVAWFTPAISVQIGPSRYGNLPGLILEIEMDGGQRSIKANKIEFKPIDASAIVKPSKGEHVSSAEFMKIRNEKLKEMGMESGGKPGAVRMIITNDRE